MNYILDTTYMRNRKSYLPKELLLSQYFVFRGKEMYVSIQYQKLNRILLIIYKY